MENEHKRKQKFFENYIPKILKKVSSKNGIASSSKQQLNTVICIVAKKIVDISVKLVEIAKKKTISEVEIKNAIKLLFYGDLCLNSIVEGDKAVEKFQSTFKKFSLKGASRQEKAGIIFPPSLTEKFLRCFDCSKIMVTKAAPIFFAASLEYLTIEILKLACIFANKYQHYRITITDLYLSISNDRELYDLFDKLNIKFIGVLKSITQIIVQPITSHNSDQYFIKEITKQNMKNYLSFSRLPLEKIIRSIMQIEYRNYMRDNINGNIGENILKISKDTFDILQIYIEQYIIDFLIDAYIVTTHSSRNKLTYNDIKLTCFMTKKYTTLFE